MIFRDEDILKDILIDCDVFRHLHFLGYFEVVNDSLPSKFIMLDIVEAELIRTVKFVPIVKHYVDKSIISLKNMSIRNKNIITEHFKFISNDVGPGESACMSVARFSDNVIGSSNLSDIYEYCGTHKISYLTTLDLLFISVLQKKLTETEFDIAIDNLRKNDYRIPNTTFKKFSLKNGTLKKQCEQLNQNK